MSAGLTSRMHSAPSPEQRLATRRALRRQFIELRMALSAAQCAELSQKICRHLQSHFPQLAQMRVGFCWPVSNEPDLLPLLRAWIADTQPGFAALLPVVQEQDKPLAFRPWTPDTPLLTDRYGIPTPAEGPFLVPDALLIPVNAFDAAGYRIGYGGGFFDRTLGTLTPRPLSIGVGYELSRIASVHPEPHDARLDAMVTEAGVFRPTSP